jgi:hypothetical protein
MSFFEPPPPPPDPPEVGPPSPDWVGPPDNVLPSPFALDLVLAHTDGLALFVHSGAAYTHGFEFTLGLRQRRPPAENGHDPMLLWHPARRRGFEEALRFGIAFADGRKATIFDAHAWRAGLEGSTRPEIVLMQRGGGGGGTCWNFQFWVWPLPPEGPLAFVAEWPIKGVPLSRGEIDSAIVRDSAARAVTLWPDEPPGHGSGSGTWTQYTT